MGTQSSLPWGVALILFIAYALFNSGTAVLNQPASAGSQPAQAQAEVEHPREEGDLACLDVPPPLRPACRQLTPARTISGELFQTPATSPDCSGKPCPPKDRRWQTQPWVQRAGKNLKVVIALVPDPEMTRLALYYGRAIDSITLAAERADYLFDSYWVPWKLPASRTAGDTAKGLPPLVPPGLDPPSTLPGALLFRQSSAAWEPATRTTGNAYLLVLLVGESNISGMRRDQFKEALYYRSTLTPDAPEVPIIGPSYSGTFASLHKCLREDKQAFPAHSYRLVSSNTTVKEARRQMRASDLQVKLTAIQRDDESTMNALLHTVKGLGRIATLSEGDTAFGATDLPQWGADPDTPVITRISFPRGIAQLRDVYPEDAPAKSTSGSSSQSSEQLPLSLRGSPAGSDTPEVFNVKHLTVAQEAQMQTIAGILNRGGFETAFIFASDVLDLTFVTGYLRQSCPNLRVIVQDLEPSLRPDHQQVVHGRRLGCHHAASPASEPARAGAPPLRRAIVLDPAARLQPVRARHLRRRLHGFQRTLPTALQLSSRGQGPAAAGMSGRTQPVFHHHPRRGGARTHLAQHRRAAEPLARAEPRRLHSVPRAGRRFGRTDSTGAELRQPQPADAASCLRRVRARRCLPGDRALQPDPSVAPSPALLGFDPTSVPKFPLAGRRL
ncbi:MAG: hypothetical protein QM757_23150 [Paludibaculum sp.]